MSSPAESLAAILEQNGLGVIGAKNGWSISIGVMPESPDTCIALTDYDGDAPDTDELDVYRPRVQIRTRSRSYSINHSKQEAIRDLLKVQSAGTSIKGITPITSIISLGNDDNDRALMTSNYEVLIN